MNIQMKLLLRIDKFISLIAMIGEEFEYSQDECGKKY